MFRYLCILCGLLAVPSWSTAAEQPAAPATKVAAGTQDAAVPEAMEHLVKAPPIDFDNLRDPFKSYLDIEEEKMQALMSEKMSELQSRPREKLENYDLVTLKLVAIFSMGDDRVAMLQDPAGKGYLVRRGNYVGKHNGKVEKITQDTVYIVEKVLNPAGDLVDRPVTLTLKELNQS